MQTLFLKSAHNVITASVGLIIFGVNEDILQTMNKKPSRQYPVH